MSKYICRLELPAMKRSDLGKVIDLEELAVEFSATTKVAMTSTSCRGCRFMAQWTLFGGRTLGIQSINYNRDHCLVTQP